MPLARTRVTVVNDFGRVTRQINDTARRAVETGARTGAQVAAGIAAQRSRTGAMANIVPTPVQGTPDGWGASFASRVFYAWFQEEGTLGNRRKPLKRPPKANRTRAPGTGIEPLRFMAAGRRAGRQAMLETIGRELPR